MKTKDLRMKKSLLLSLFTILVTLTVSAQNVNIPDANFKAYLVADPNINTNADAEIQISEATAFSGSINCNFLNIFDFTGLEAFVNLTSLTIVYNPVTTLDVSQNTALTVLDVYINSLTSLDVSHNTALVELRCERNPIGSLDVSNLTQLNMLTCNDCSLTSLDVSNNPMLTLLDAGNYYSNSMNQLTSIDVSNNTQLEQLNVSRNLLTSLNANNNTALEILGCNGNQLTNLNTSNLVSLNTLYAGHNLFTTLDFSANLNLEILDIANNPLTGTIDISNHTAVRQFSCDQTQISGLNLANGHNSEFTNLYIYGNDNLSCIEVDDAAWADANWTSWQHKDPWASYSEDCILEIKDDKSILGLYPNPVNDALYIELGENTEVQIKNLMGETLITYNTEKGVNTIDVSNLPSSIYFVSIAHKTDQKFIKL